MTDWEQNGVSTAGDDSWLQTDRSAEEEIARSSNWLLIAAAAAVAVGLLALAGGIALNLLGYVASSLAAFTLVALFRRRSIRRSALIGISPSRSVNLISLSLLAVGFGLSLVHAWLIASYFS